MSNLSEIILDYSPANGQSGVPLRSTVSVVFSGILDERSVKESFFLEGPDTDGVIGPDSSANIWPSRLGILLGEEHDYLTSPGFHGVVPGTFEFSNGEDSTTLSFSPASPLAALTEYTVHITDLYSSSIGEVSSGVNNGNGTLSLFGTWSGPEDTLNVCISSSGVAGIAEFIWWKDSDVEALHGPILSSRREPLVLESDLFVSFGDGIFAENDTFRADTSEAILCSGHVTFSFETGTGSITVLPSSGSTSVISALRQDPGSSLSPLAVVSTDPENHEIKVDPDLTFIEVTFNKEIDPNAITEENVRIIVSPATDHPSVPVVARGEIPKKIEVSGNKVKIGL